MYTLRDVFGQRFATHCEIRCGIIGIDYVMFGAITTCINKKHDQKHVIQLKNVKN